MKYKQNLHTHTSFCDGKNSVEEVIKKAIELGFDSIGFSGHSYMHYSENHSMSLDGTKEYVKEINRLKDVYKDKLKLFCGIEYDMYSDLDISEFDYSIGSFHYFLIDGEYVGFDRGQGEVQSVIDKCFGGDGMAYAKAYYEALAELPKYGRFDIIGHFDLITKHSDNIRFFDENSKEYMDYAISSAEALRGKIPYFEVNTGAIARGYRKTPYPSIPILKELKRLGFGAVITSDCHDANMLDCGFDNAEELLKECGFKQIHILTETGFKGIDI